MQPIIISWRSFNTRCCPSYNHSRLVSVLVDFCTGRRQTNSSNSSGKNYRCVQCYDGDVIGLNQIKINQSDVKKNNNNPVQLLQLTWVKALNLLWRTTLLILLVIWTSVDPVSLLLVIPATTVTPDISYRDILHMNKQEKKRFTLTKYKWVFKIVFTFPSNWPPRELSCQKSKSRHKTRHNFCLHRALCIFSGLPIIK